MKCWARKVNEITNDHSNYRLTLRVVVGSIYENRSTVPTNEIYFALRTVVQVVRQTLTFNIRLALYTHCSIRIEQVLELWKRCKVVISKCDILINTL